MAGIRAVGGIKRKYPADGVGGFCDGPDSSTARKVKQEHNHHEEIDLTNGKYDPSQQSDSSVVDANNTIICFGSIFNIHAQFLTGPPGGCSSSSSNADNEGTIHHLEILLGSENCVIYSPLTDDIIGFVNLGVSNALRGLFEIEETRLTIPLLHSEWKCMTQYNTPNAWESSVEITIFGSRKNALLVGDYLSSQALFLQDPTTCCDIQYENPHKFPFTSVEKLDSEASDLDDYGCLTMNEAIPTSAKISERSLQNVLDNLHEHDYLEQVQPDEHLVIPLFAHQKEGIDFMIRRETGRSTSSISLWDAHMDNYSNICQYHAITGDSALEVPVGPLGGIIADTMGLGKTVTTLSTIASTLLHAKEWGKRRDAPWSAGLRTAAATMVVLPNEVLILISKFKPGTFKTCKYHGASRKVHFPTFEDYDIVLTTYGTISTDFTGKESPIFQTDFFRIVLDEAHHIKSRSTMIHEAACNISADRRWCLTGTPIQNDLDDLGALVSFLRVPLLEDREVFRKHIINQTYNISGDRFENLRLLLGCICLRRTMSLGMLVKPTINNLKLNLAPEEREAYINILDYHNRLIDVSVSKGGSVGGFQTVLQLRIFCNNGLYRKKDIRASPTDLLTSEEYLNFWQGNHESQSPGTDSEALALGSYKLSDSKTSPESSNSVGEPCRMSRQSSNMLDLAKIEGPASELLHAPNLVRESLTPEYLSLVDQSLQALEGTFSTKHHAILKTILGHIPQEKGIVFSAWTKSLDIMAELLRHHDIAFARVDGSMSFSQRQQAFQSFKTSRQAAT
ncbi:helicase [Aspergillus piperis CBS 112811]|uniref:Helicase n=1 Tax=Aspergillus piperis CBS 112811 TaxID=1448313 RepID=A0A8G1VSX6_9EURO|nr:helicase [Aspergillus piperis CBS 112811]RAH63410.1 helicase [Aspergillus piperis CBS 112811]